MTPKSFNEIWSAIALIALFTATNTALQTQGSELFLSFPKVEGGDRSAITVYGILISAPLAIFSIRLAFIYRRQFGEKGWAGCMPIAFNREIIASTRLGKSYQKFSYFLLIALPVLLQYHLLSKFFDGSLFFRNEKCTAIAPEVYDKFRGKEIANSMSEHLTTFFPFNCSFENHFYYAQGIHSEGSVTFFPGYQAWFFVLLEAFLFGYFLYYSYILFFKSKEHSGLLLDNKEGEEKEKTKNKSAND